MDHDRSTGEVHRAIDMVLCVVFLCVLISESYTYIATDSLFCVVFCTEVAHSHKHT